MKAIIFCIVIGVVILLECYFLFRNEQKRVIVEPLSWYKRMIPPRVELSIQKNRKRRPESIVVSLSNNQKRSVDLIAMEIHFSKWFRTKKFRISKVEQQTLFPLLIEKNKSVQIPISIISFYKKHKELEQFEKIVVIVKERGGQRFKSSSKSLWRF